MRTPDNRLAFIRHVRRNSCCSVCGDARKIQFHHLRNKRFWLGDQKTVMSVPLNVVIAEIQKCIPLCPTCHDQLHTGHLTIDVEQAILQHECTIFAAKAKIAETKKRRKEETKKRGYRKH